MAIRYVNNERVIVVIRITTYKNKIVQGEEIAYK